jgi:hypothetical protein
MVRLSSTWIETSFLEENEGNCFESSRESRAYVNGRKAFPNNPWDFMPQSDLGEPQSAEGEGIYNSFTVGSCTQGSNHKYPQPY